MTGPTLFKKLASRPASLASDGEKGMSAKDPNVISVRDPPTLFAERRWRAEVRHDFLIDQRIDREGARADSGLPNPAVHRWTPVW